MNIDDEQPAVRPVANLLGCETESNFKYVRRESAKTNPQDMTVAMLILPPFLIIE
jgi:hypothetical protein